MTTIKVDIPIIIKNKDLVQDKKVVKALEKGIRHVLNQEAEAEKESNYIIKIIILRNKDIQKKKMIIIINNILTTKEEVKIKIKAIEKNLVDQEKGERIKKTVAKKV